MATAVLMAPVPTDRGARSCKEVYPSGPAEHMWKEFLSYCKRGDFQSVLKHPLVWRLAEIGHYGLLPDFFGDIHPIVANTPRLDHTLGVAYLAFSEARQQYLSDGRRDALIFAALFHDIGHTALSHSLEPVFLCEYGWDHNVEAPGLAQAVGNAVGLPDRLSANIESILRRADPLSALLFGQLGLDSLENIQRALHLRTQAGAEFHKSSIWQGEPVLAIRRSADETDRLLLTKTQLYGEFFYDPHYQIFERVIQALVLANLPDLYSRTRSAYAEYPAPLHLTDPDIRGHLRGEVANVRRIIREIDPYRADESAPRVTMPGPCFELPIRRRSIRLVSGQVEDQKRSALYRFSSVEFADLVEAIPTLGQFITRVK
jgi:HD superfamily phosphohydrolase